MLPAKATAREVLAYFMPAHDLCSVASADATRDSIFIMCSCGAKLPVTRIMCKSYETDLEAVKHGLRNVLKKWVA